MEIGLKQLKSLLKTLEEGGASEFEYQDDKYRIRLRIGATAAAAAPARAQLAPEAVTIPPPPPPAAASEADDASIVYVTSPFVGTFYRAPNPESPAFAEVGSVVKKGKPLCIIEAMKLMNEIESEYDGTVLEVLVENGHSVEFGQKLFKIRRA